MVLSSCWRHGFIDWTNADHPLVDRDEALPTLQKWMNDCGLPGDRLIDVTPDFIQRTVEGQWQSGHRGTEIGIFLKQHPEVTKFVILDDDTDLEPFLEWHVQTHEPFGLTLENAKQAISILSS